MRVEHAVIKTWRRPQDLNSAGIDVSGCLFVYPNQISYRAGVRLSFSQGVEHIEFTGAGIAMFTEMGVEC